MKVEKAIFRPSVEHANPLGVGDFFADVFAALDAAPRAVEAEIDFSETGVGEAVVIDLEKGEPVFCQPGAESFRCKFGGRWLAEHDVPMALSRGKTRLCLTPTDGNRVKVRLLPRLGH